jgi:hypothetical protein
MTFKADPLSFIFMSVTHLVTSCDIPEKRFHTPSLIHHKRLETWLLIWHQQGGTLIEIEPSGSLLEK